MLANKSTLNATSLNHLKLAHQWLERTNRALGQPQKAAAENSKALAGVAAGSRA